MERAIQSPTKVSLRDGPSEPVSAEAPHRLRQFDPDISTADHRQMFGDHIQLQRPDVRHRLGLGKRLRFRPGLRHASLKADVPLFGKDVRDM